LAPSTLQFWIASARLPARRRNLDVVVTQNRSHAHLTGVVLH
jgi:hypothetical protein